MIDKNQDQDQNQDEYQFADLDMIEPEADEADQDIPIDSKPNSGNRFTSKQIIRNSLIAVGGLIVLMVIYKFVGAIFSSEDSEKKAIPTAVIKPAVPIAPVQPSPPIVAQSLPSSPDEMRKIAVLEVAQSNMSTDVNNLNNQVATLGTDVSDLNNKFAQLTQSLNALTAQITAQNRQIELLSVRSRPTKPHYVQRKAAVPANYYYIQAVIPGRAWLVATNGTTISVREGTSVAGYGVIKLIDPTQGRILTSSGRVITFSQQDS